MQIRSYKMDCLVYRLDIDIDSEVEKKNVEYF